METELNEEQAKILKAEVEALRRKIESLEQENERLRVMVWGATRIRKSEEKAAEVV